ncbi:hypothetical protein [Erwinia amylovora]|uniref:Uncharacterized protein n=1 Tax=Erwinia amylovora TaxID=552 RepID=A0ABX7MD95_ERWAM|nr:hypothetical protein [Erwinia amylovora]MBZ2389521.1 hypothetical protein [Erwinia amylovora]MBZ2396518.1 hypothetical protein [Erwinia amylovora]MBZ2399841.1 hypothetical protein [Erwinia amylovora]MBZ2402568.1 hypothetical protein [Erwinia amylovora]MCK8155846.1 hypothetical protein [Erwinia amylovora]
MIINGRSEIFFTDLKYRHRQFMHAGLFFQRSRRRSALLHQRSILQDLTNPALNNATV